MEPGVEYRLLAELEASFDRLVEHSEALVEEWRHSGGDAWAFDGSTPDTTWLHRALLDFWYQDGQDGRSTRSHVGLVAANEWLIQQAGQVNAAKATFARLLADIRRDAPVLLPEIKAILPFRHPGLHDHLRGSGLARLHLKQCWRAIPLAPAPVERVRLAWYASGRSIKRLSVQEADLKLQQLDSEAAHVRIQRRKLAGLPSDEPLAQVQTQAPLMRANLFFQQALDDGQLRRAMNVALPLFLPSQNGRLPDYNKPPQQPPEKRTRARRSDERLEATPLLPSLRIYRYRDS